MLTESAQATLQVREEQKLIARAIENIGKIGPKFTTASIFTSEYLHQQAQMQNSFLFSLPQVLLGNYR